MLLITGCGRSGTKYISMVLRRAGLDVGHETRLGEDGIVSSFWTVDADRYPGRHVQGPQPKFDVILHQVRNPLRTISSLTTGSQKSWKWNARYIPIAEDAPALRKAADYWYYWNLLADARSDWTYNIELLEEEWEEFSRMTGITCTYGEATDGLSKNTNTRPHIEYTWTDIKHITPLYEEIRILAMSYGYQE